MNSPDFTLDKIKFATDGATFEKAVKLYKGGKLQQSVILVEAWD